MASNHSRVASSPNSNGISQDTIQHRAYEIWLEEGKPMGRDLEHWLKAEQELVRSSVSSVGAATSAGKKPAAKSSSKPKRLVSVN